MTDSPETLSSLRRALGLLRLVGAADAGGIRLKDLAAAAGCSQPTAHRALQDLAAEGFVEQVGKRYRLALDFFVLAARAGQAGGLRDLARPVLLRLSATLADTIFLLVRNGYDAVCLDRIEGPFPIRSFTGDIGGKVPLGLGQGSLAILAHLPEAEREAVIRFNVPRLLDRGFLDEAALRVELAKAREQGWVNLNTGLIPGMAGTGSRSSTQAGVSSRRSASVRWRSGCARSACPASSPSSGPRPRPSARRSIRSMPPCAIRRAA